MHSYTISLTLACTVSLILGFYILRIDYKSTINILFFIKSLIVCGFAFSALMIQLSINTIEVLFWYKIMLFFLIIIPVTFLHFYIRIAGIKLSQILIPIFYLPSLIIIFFIFFFRNPLLSEYCRYRGLWVVSEPGTNHFFIIFMSYIVIYPLVLYYIIYQWGKKSNLNKEKHHARLAFFSLTLTLSISILCDIIINSFFYKLPHIGPLAFFIYFVFIFFALTKYRFLNYDIKNNMDGILHNIDELVFILDPSGAIIKTSDVVNNKVRAPDGIIIHSRVFRHY